MPGLRPGVYKHDIIFDTSLVLDEIYIFSLKARTGRSILEFRLPPVIHKVERIKLEKVINASEGYSGQL